MTVLKDVLDDGGDRAQEQDHPDEADERDDGGRVLLHFQPRTHRSKSGHVQGDQLLDEAGKPVLLVWSHMDDRSPHMGWPTIRDLNRARNHFRIGQRELQIQLFPLAKRSLDPQSDPFLGHIDDVAKKGFVASPNVAGSIDRDTIELSLLRHGAVHFLGVWVESWFKYSSRFHGHPLFFKRALSPMLPCLKRRSPLRGC